MLGLLDLPDELLLFIVRLVSDDCPVTDVDWGYVPNFPQAVHPLLQVNRQLYRVVLPILYQRINMGAFTNGCRQTCALIKTLISSRQISGMVQELLVRPSPELGEDGGLFFQDESEKYPNEEKAKRDALAGLDSNDAKYMQSIIDRAFPEDAKQRAKWMEGSCIVPEIGHVTAIALVGLRSLVRLRLLGYMDNVVVRLGEIMDGLRDQAEISGFESPLPSLRVVTVGDSIFAKYPDSTLPLGVVARWPNVTSIRAKEVADHESTGPRADLRLGEMEFEKIKANSSRLTRLTLRPQTMVSGPRLQKLLSAPKALQYFDCHFGHAWAWIHVTSSEFQHALDQQKHSLKRITFHHLAGAVPREWAAMSFASFDQLKTLEISAYLLFGEDVLDDKTESSTFGDHIRQALPESVQSFSIVQCRGSTCIKAASAAFGTIVRLKPTRFPQMRSLMVAFIQQGIHNIGMMMQLKETAAAAEIKLDVMTCTDDSFWDIRFGPYEHNEQDVATDRVSESGIGGQDADQATGDSNNNDNDHKLDV